MANSAARRPESRCAAISSSSRIGTLPDISPREPRMRQHDADQQRLLLAGRAEFGRHRLGAVADERGRSGAGPSSVRPAARSRSRPAASAWRKLSSISTAGAWPTIASSEPDRARSACGKGLAGSLSIMAASSRTISARAAAMAVPDSSHLRLDRLEPGPVARSFGEQPVAAAHRLLVVLRAPAVAGIDRQHQPVEEAAAVAGRAGEQRVHRRRQPEHAQPFEQVVGRASACALMRTRRPASPPGSRPAVPVPMSHGPVAAVEPRRGRPSRRCRPRARPRHRARGAGRAPASAARSLRAGWSCRRRCRR